MKIESFISKYNIQKIKKLEQKDPQFLALKESWEKIQNKDENLFLYLTLQCALVSYQIAWTWELRRQEFGDKIQKDQKTLQELRQKKQDNSVWRYDFLTNSKYNKRIYNIKTNRIKKINKILQKNITFRNFWNKLEELNDLISKVMNTKKDSKTNVFAVKMFWYAHEIISWKKTIYPMNIQIPVDSRIKRIYTNSLNIKNKVSNTEIQNYFQTLSKKYNIPPLHLDSILWLDYWTRFFI